MTEPKTDPDPSDLTTKDGVIDHVRARIEEIYETTDLRGIAYERQAILAAAKETAYMELFADLFARVKALEPNTEGWDCQACGKPLEKGPGFCSQACVFAWGESREPHSS